MEIGIVQPINIVQEMRTSFLDYALSVIVSRALPDVRDGLKPVQRRILYGMWDHRQPAQPAFQEMCRNRRRRTGQNASAQRRRRVRRARAAGASMEHALPAGGSAGQLRQRGRRLTGGDALYRGAADADRRRAAQRYRKEHRRFRPQLRRHLPGAQGIAGAAAEPAAERRGRYRRRHGHQYSAAQSQRAMRRDHAIDRQPRGDGRRADRAHPWAGFPDRWRDPG